MILTVCHHIFGYDHFKGAYALVDDFTSMHMWVALIGFSGLLHFLKRRIYEFSRQICFVVHFDIDRGKRMIYRYR